MSNNNNNRTSYLNSKLFEPRNRLIISLILIIIIGSLLITTITFAVLWNRSKSSHHTVYAVNKGVIGFPPVLPNDGKYIQWSILQLNDVYEMLPLDEGRKGGLARVARARQLLKEENPLTYTILSGDFLSPSALSQSIVNGSTLNGKQMISTLNVLGLDFVTFGNHEFDLNQTELISRMNESTFTWISSNVFIPGTNQSFYSSIPFKLIQLNQIKILFIGLTIDVDKKYIHIINQTSLIPFVKDFLKSLSYLKYDVLIALTHLDIAIDVELSENIPEIDLILGGHEHEDYFLYRGSKYTPITKADANAYTVYIHRCAFNLNTKEFRVYTTFTKITPEIENDEKTNKIANYWFNLGIKGFEEMGFKPNEIVSCLPNGIELDGRSTSVRNFATLLSDNACKSISNNSETNIGIFNSGSIRIDDILRGKITQYDILRVFPFQDNLFSLSVPGIYLANLLTHSQSMKGSGSFLAYCGIDTPDQGKTWFINGEDISKTGLNYNIGTISYLKETEFNDPTVNVIQQFNITQTHAFISYLKIIYPPC